MKNTSKIAQSRYVSGRITGTRKNPSLLAYLPWIGKAIRYRIRKPVVQVCVMLNGDSFSICPRCDCLLDREYMNFCDCCGQKLSWGLFRFATVVYAPRRK